MNERRIAVLQSSSPTLEDGRSARILPTETLTTKAQYARARGGTRHCVLTTGTIESLGWGRRPVVDGSDGVITGGRHGFLGALGGCAVDMTTQYAAVGEVFLRVDGYSSVVHGVGDVGQPAVIVGIMLGLMA